MVLRPNQTKQEMTDELGNVLWSILSNPAEDLTLI